VSLFDVAVLQFRVALGGMPVVVAPTISMS
jgi:hypothetical protein